MLAAIQLQVPRKKLSDPKKGEKICPITELHINYERSRDIWQQTSRQLNTGVEQLVTMVTTPGHSK